MPHGPITLHFSTCTTLSAAPARGSPSRCSAPYPGSTGGTSCRGLRGRHGCLSSRSRRTETGLANPRLL
ncbi:hypothetical protein PF008_g32241 [Phytophthora fragariae]|uniref:Uncharacterized protein n=1 Tax=Phytophthora fragariae TaxID=53985 RepID=A0A6G0Q0G0_9STRA|nr:hypothetical protein PF008_g32241 [Phytophthora fragariae]